MALTRYTPRVRSVGAVASNAGAITPGLPAGVTENDILVLFLETNDQAITVSGWTGAGSSPQSEATDVTRLTVFWKRAGASESAPTTSDSGDHQVGRIIAIAGCPTSGDPFNVTSGSSDSTSSTSAAIPGVTTTVDNCLVLAACGITRDLSSTTNFSSWTNANLTDLTEQIDNTVTAGLGGGMGVASGGKASAGATGNTTVTLAVAGRKTYWCGALLGREVEAFPSAGILDDFNRVDENPLAGGWSTNTVFGAPDNRCQIISNQAAPIDTTDGQSAVWGTNFNADQEFYVTLATISGLSEIGLHARLTNEGTGGSESMYSANFGTGNIEISRTVSGTWTQLGSLGSQAISAGDAIGLRVEGPTVSVWYKPSGGSWAPLEFREDPNITGSGKAGWNALVSTTAPRFDDAGGGNMVAAGGSRRVFVIS